MTYKADTTGGGIGVCGALGVAFVVLKLCGILGWSWWWVLAPFWGPPAAVIAVLAAAFAAGGTFAKGPPRRAPPAPRLPTGPNRKGAVRTAVHLRDGTPKNGQPRC